MAGLYFEEFHEGQEFHHEFSRTVTEMDNTMFSLLTMNPQPLHIDAHFAENTEFGQRLFNSLYTLGIMIGMSVYDTTLGTTIGNLGENISVKRFARFKVGDVAETDQAFPVDHDGSDSRL